MENLYNQEKVNLFFGVIPSHRRGSVMSTFTVNGQSVTVE